MARANLLDDQQRRGEVPGVCAVTGKPTGSVVLTKVVQPKTWTWILLPFGVLPFVIARVFSSNVWTVELPVHSSAWRRYLVRRRLSWVVLAAGAAIALASIGPRPIELGVIVGLIGLVINAANSWAFPSVHRAGRDFPGFIVSRCHPDFAYRAGVLARQSPAMAR